MVRARQPRRRAQVVASDPDTLVPVLGLAFAR
jgi:hypothetical protein